MVRELNLIGHFDESEIITQARTVTTDDEVRTFKDLAKINGWKNLKTLGVKAHAPRIENSISSHFGNDQKVPVLSAEDVLSQNTRYSRVLTEMKSWPEITSPENQEASLAKISEIPGVGKFIVETAPRLIPAKLKIALQSLLFRIREK